ncbi:MAG: ferritin-like domain-containing protein [Gaiellaceae bacterium]
MGSVSNPRDLLLELLGQLLFVERRLADGVLRELVEAVHDEELKGALRHHLEQTERHAERAEIVFRRLDAAPSSNLSRPFEAGKAEHDDRAPSIKPAALADVFHAQTALHTEHWEIAAYTAVLAIADAMGHGDAVADLRESLRDEEEARDALQQLVQRLAADGCAR